MTKKKKDSDTAPQEADTNQQSDVGTQSEPENPQTEGQPESAAENNEPETAPYDGVSSSELWKQLEALDDQIKAKREERANVALEMQRRLKKKP